MEDAQSASVRNAAFAWLEHLQNLFGDTVPRTVLEQGFEHGGTRVRVIGPQGIFKPKQIRYFPLSITTTTKSPYADSFDADGNNLQYSYRGIDPEFHENRRLRDAIQSCVPLIYFYGTVPGQYVVVFPVYVVGDDRDNLKFKIAADTSVHLGYDQDDRDDTFRRMYVTREVRQRLHQRSFRDRVLLAYRERCSVCRLRHTRLLDAAHIVPDAEDGGEPVVSNGLSLCKIHHAAFDSKYFGIRPSHRIVVRPDIMNENDGPMLRHGLQAINDSKIIVPRQMINRPDPERLSLRFDSFAESANL